MADQRPQEPLPPLRPWLALRPKSVGGWVRRVILLVGALSLLNPNTAHPSLYVLVTDLTGYLAVLVLLFYFLRWMGRPVVAEIRQRRSKQPVPQPQAVDLLGDVRERCLRAGGGPHLGLAFDHQPRFARRERAVLLLGPPRSGKTSGVIIPTIIAHTGPVVATSTKPDVLAATSRARGRVGRVWVFDPAGTSTTAGVGGLGLRWSPVTASASWDDALLLARAMTSGVGAGTTDRSHWATRSQALLAALLHAAAIHGHDMATVVGWVMSHDLDQAGVLLEDRRCSQLAFQTLVGLFHTDERERSAIFSSTASALTAYTGQRALELTRNPNFNTHQFVQSQDTIYIHAPAEQQTVAAPLVCGLLAEIRRATYQAHAQRQLAGRVLFALDEVANIAPLEELPQIASEGASQGLLLLAALQDLSQARARWGEQADGFLTLFGTKLILPGIADTKTLEAVSMTLGEYDRQVVSNTRTRVPGHGVQRAKTRSTLRTPVMSPGEIAGIPAGRALHLDGVSSEVLTLTPAHRSEPWRTLTTPGPAAAS